MFKQLTDKERWEAMRKYPAKIIPYAEYDENVKFVCPVCGWQGTSKESGMINTDSHFALDVSCPICDKMLLVAEYALANPIDTKD